MRLDPHPALWQGYLQLPFSIFHSETYLAIFLSLNEVFLLFPFFPSSPPSLIHSHHPIFSKLLEPFQPNLGLRSVPGLG